MPSLVSRIPYIIPLANVDLLVPLAPDLGRSEHTTRAALVTESSLTSTVSTTTRDTGDTSDSATCKANPSSATQSLVQVENFSVSTYRYPRTQRRSVHQPSRSRHKAVSCSSPYRCEPACNEKIPVSQLSRFRCHCVAHPALPQPEQENRRTYWTISGRMGEVKTAGRGWEAPLALPSAVAIVTVGRDAIVVDGEVVVVVVRG